MRLLSWLFPLGMIAVLSFLALDIIGSLLWVGYNPIHSYVSELLVIENPHVHLMRTFMNIYTVCFCLFIFAILIHAYRSYHLCAKIGYTVLFVVALMSVFGYGVPISMAFIFIANNIFHLLLTISILCATILAMILIAVGYFRQEHFIIMGKISRIATILFILFNAWHIVAILTGQNILGLVERLTFYSFHAFTLLMSWIYTFGKRS